MEDADDERCVIVVVDLRGIRATILGRQLLYQWIQIATGALCHRGCTWVAALALRIFRHVIWGTRGCAMAMLCDVVKMESRRFADFDLRPILCRLRGDVDDFGSHSVSGFTERKLMSIVVILPNEMSHPPHDNEEDK